ncbi:MAG: alpha-ketoglutarate-dependent dioxygenase AlkB [Flavobacteriaceae bacterium]|nr:alpha-ketoglutarate-dependent dioxygenase AlkB [Flavobacteriaceae bacterium]
MTSFSNVYAPELPNAVIRYYPNFLSPDLADTYFNTLHTTTPWRNDPITVFGKTYPQPRMTSLHGHNDMPYGYSGIVMRPEPMTKTLLEIEEKLSVLTTKDFNTVLLNLYRDGKDSNGWHADNEPELGKNPVIASISLGANRFFHLKHNTNKNERLKIALEHGSLLLMEGTTQHFWKHQVAKTARPVGVRINLTYRNVIKVP